MKLLLCDDDILTLDAIESQLDCAALGISQVLRAYNGEAAKAMVEREQPELILCDIGMPICDGLEVLRYVHEHRVETEFTFLTCYEDFEYARTAIQYGAFGYLTKPFEMAELERTLLSMVEAATARRLDRIGQSQARHDSVMNSVLRQLSYGLFGSGQAAAEALLRQNGLDIPADSRWHLVLSCGEMSESVSAGWSREVLMYTVGRLHDEVLAGYIGAAYTLLYADERYLWCRCFVPRRECGREELFARCAQLCELCAEHAAMRPAVLVSGEFPLYEAGTVCGQMSERMRGMRSAAGRICALEDADGIGPIRESRLDGPYILRLIKENDQQGFCRYIQAALEAGADTETLDALRRELIWIFTDCLRDNELDPGAVFQGEGVAGAGGVAARSAQGLLRFAQVLFQAVEEQLRRLSDSADIIARVERYIREHFREDITRDDVAAIVYITPNYLSKLFRSRMGMNLREHINQIRIEEARRLLLTTNLPVSEIAGHVGYDNISYFSTVFRKLVGMSPVDWRNSGREEAGDHEAG